MDMVNAREWQEPYKAWERQAWLGLLFAFLTGVEDLHRLLQIPPLPCRLAKGFDLTQECLNQLFPFPKAHFPASYIRS